MCEYKESWRVAVWNLSVIGLSQYLVLILSAYAHLRIIVRKMPQSQNPTSLSNGCSSLGDTLDSRRSLMLKPHISRPLSMLATINYAFRGFPKTLLPCSVFVGGYSEMYVRNSHLCRPKLIFAKSADAQVGVALRLDRRVEDGSLEKSSAVDFYRGDLVEALATVDISVETEVDLIPRTSVYLSFNHATVVTCAHLVDEVSLSSFLFESSYSYEARYLGLQEKSVISHVRKIFWTLVLAQTWVGGSTHWRWTLKERWTPKIEGVERWKRREGLEFFFLTNTSSPFQFGLCVTSSPHQNGSISTPFGRDMGVSRRTHPRNTLRYSILTT